MAVGYVYDPIYLDHHTENHPESPERLSAIIDHLRAEGILDELVRIAPRKATVEELLTVHSDRHIDKVDQVSRRGDSDIEIDTQVSRRSYEVALWAVGGVIRAVEEVVAGNVDSAFALVRPPGHHATRTEAMGFCLFNNIAVAARYALNHLGIKRILIADYDVHHGNGTSDAFYADDSVLYFSTHQSPYYPGTGDADEIGYGRGVGYTINVPLPPHVGDEGYARVFQEILVPAARRFKPELILVSAGFDAHAADPLASMDLSTAGYANLARCLKSLANELCQGRLVFALEGGYDLKAQAASVAATFSVLMNRPVADAAPSSSHQEPDITSILNYVKRLHGL